MSSTKVLLTIMPLLALGMLALVGNTIFGLYISFMKLTAHQFGLLSISIVLLLAWGVISFGAYFLYGITGFTTESAETWQPWILLIYIAVGGVVFWGFKVIGKSAF